MSLRIFVATLSGANDISAIARLGEEKLSWLRGYLAYASGTPSHDTVALVLALLRVDILERMWVQWMM